MKKYVEIIKSNRRVFFVLFMIINIVAILGVLKLDFDTDFAIFTTQGSKHEELLEETERLFGETSQVVILLEDDEFTFDDVEALFSINEFIQSQDGIESYQGMRVDSTPIPVSSLEAVKQVFLDMGEFSPLIIKDETYYQFTLIINDDYTREDINELEEFLDSTEYTPYIAGDFYNQVKVIDYILFILSILPPLALITILLVFKSQIKSFKATLLSILPAGVGALWTMGFIGFIGNEVSILSAVVPIFVIVIGSADGLHFISHIQDSRRDGLSNTESIVETLKMVGIPMIVTTLTSMAGFLALLTMNTDSVYDLAVFASIGILFAGIATWFVLPIILSGDVKGLMKKDDKHVPIEIGIKKMWGLPSVIVTVVILITSVLAYSSINNEFDMLMVYKDYTEVKQSAEKVQDVMGGTVPLFVVSDIEFSNEGLMEVNQLVNELEETGNVSRIVNPLEFISFMAEQNNIPLQPQMIPMILSQIDNDSVSSLVNVEEGKIRFMLFPVDMENDTLASFELDREDSYVTGVQYLMRDLNLGIQQMQFNSILFALLFVFVMMFITLRSFKIALASIVPIIITVVGVYGFLGLTGISLNVTTTMIFSITIGVGIDYAVHYSSVYRVYSKSMSRLEAVQKAFKYTSRPIIANALGISLGLTIMMLSPLNIHFNVSVLMWVSMIISVFITLTILPLIFTRGKLHE